MKTRHTTKGTTLISSLLVYPKRSLSLPRRTLKRAGLQLARYWKTVEARTSNALQMKVSTKTAAGWVPDGQPVQVTHYTRGRARSSFSQLMFIPLSTAAI